MQTLARQCRTALDDLLFLAPWLALPTLSLAEVAATRAWPLTLNRHAGYDHSYYFVASFIEAHLRFHANHLGEPA